MSLRSVIVASLLLGDQYGLQLHHEIVARTARPHPLNVGQVYATLDRLHAAGLVAEVGRTDDDLVLHGLTGSGRDAALAWVATPVTPLDWNDMREQVLLVSSMPGIPLGVLTDAYMTAWSEARFREVHDDLGVDAALATAALAWLRGLERLPARQRPLDANRPPRGRRPVHFASA